MSAETRSEAPQRRQRTRKLVNNMLVERESMLMLLWKVSGRVEHDQSDTDLDKVRDFVTVLVDYIAAGHFVLYQRIDEGSERREAVRRIAAEVYPRIAEISDVALDFNDRFGDALEQADRDELNKAVEMLAELLIERIALEDRLIEAMFARAA